MFEFEAKFEAGFEFDPEFDEIIFGEVPEREEIPEVIPDLSKKAIMEEEPPEEEKPPDDEETGTLEPTWWLFKVPGIKNLMEVGKELLEDMFDKFDIRPLIIDDEEIIYEAKYEWAKYNEQLTHSQAKLDEAQNPIGWADFLGGFPYGIVELMALLYERATDKDKYPVQKCPDEAAPPVPDDLFEGYEKEDTVYNILYFEEELANLLCDAWCDGLYKVQTPNWWQRLNWELPAEERKKPIPGEFVALGIRLFPNKPWLDQESSPFISSGNWFDMLYYTSAKVIEVLEPDESRPFKHYKVRWRAKEEGGETEFLAHPSGFEEYEIGDRVTIVKDAATERTSQTWEDDQEFDQEVWRIAPITFYGKELSEEE